MNEIKVGHLLYQIQYVPPEELPEEHGCCVPDYQYIKVSQALSPEKMLEVELHELVHAMWDVAGLKESATEEEVATALGKVLAGVVLDNGWSVAPFLIQENDEPFPVVAEFVVDDDELIH